MAACVLSRTLLGDGSKQGEVNSSILKEVNCKACLTAYCAGSLFVVGTAGTYWLLPKAVG